MARGSRHGQHAGAIAQGSSSGGTAGTGCGIGHGGCRSRGYALAMALLALVVVSLSTTMALRHARVEAQRQKETQLLWVGNQMRQALRHYHASNPSDGPQEFPRKLEDLVTDPRSPTPLHHLRRLYPDPITGLTDWALEREGDQIIGVHSRSQAKALRRSYGDDPPLVTGPRYADWHFRAADGAPQEANPAPSADPSPLPPSTSAAPATQAAPAIGALTPPG